MLNGYVGLYVKKRNLKKQFYYAESFYYPIVYRNAKWKVLDKANSYSVAAKLHVHASFPVTWMSRVCKLSVNLTIYIPFF